MNKAMAITSFWGITLLLGFATCTFAEDAEIKLDSNDGSTKFIVQDKDAVPVFNADSLGNTVVSGTVTVVGSTFSVAGSSFVVKGGNVGIGTANPMAKLEVAGQVKIAGGDPGVGKVLTSDSSGLASWQVADSTFSIGQSYGGGKIFWLDASGRHGLIAATADQSAGIPWSNNTNFTGANLEGVYAGKADTVIISTMQGAGSYAAQVCADYAVTVNSEYYDDWYLPSSYELQLLYVQKAVIGGFTANVYWSSNEYVPDTIGAWYMGFGTGLINSGLKTSTNYLRCVRGGP